MTNKIETFAERLYECNRHKEKLLFSAKRLEALMPLTIARYEELSMEEESFIDQMVFRFSKLQDALGEKLFPSLLELMSEEVKSKPFIDRLNRIEELGILYKDEWMELRRKRNEIAHEYSFNKEDVVCGINDIHNSIRKLVGIYNTFYSYCMGRFEFIKNSQFLAQMSNGNHYIENSKKSELSQVAT
ncbi:conserved hypothetical protein [Gammaproteobacteria bacterium]